MLWICFPWDTGRRPKRGCALFSLQEKVQLMRAVLSHRLSLPWCKNVLEWALYSSRPTYFLVLMQLLLKFSAQPYACKLPSMWFCVFSSTSFSMHVLSLKLLNASCSAEVAIYYLQVARVQVVKHLISHLLGHGLFLMLRLVWSWGPCVFHSPHTSTAAATESGYPCSSNCEYSQHQFFLQWQFN